MFKRRWPCSHSHENFFACYNFGFSQGQGIPCQPHPPYVETIRGASDFLDFRLCERLLQSLLANAGERTDSPMARASQ